MNHRFRPLRPARGIATLELAMSLPLLFGLLVVVYSIASAAVARNDASFSARNKVAAGQDSPQPDSEDYHLEPIRLPNQELLEKMLGPNPPQPPQTGILTATETQQVPYVAPALQSMISDAQAIASTLGGPWDHRHLPFPSESQHPRLTMMDKVKFLGDWHDFALDAFSELANLSSAGLDSLDADDLQPGMEKLLSPLTDMTTAVADAMADRNDLIDRVTKDRDNAPDDATRERLERQLSNLRTERDHLQNATNAFNARPPLIEDWLKQSSENPE